MNLVKLTVATTALALLAAPLPAAAAPRWELAPQPANGAAPRHFLFAGATLRVPLQRDHAGADHPQLALRLSGATRSPVMTSQIGEGLALGLGAGKGPARLTIAGRSATLGGPRSNLSGGTALAIGGAVLLVGLAVAFATTKKVPDDGVWW